MGGEETDRLQVLWLNGLDFVVWGVVGGIGPPDEHGGGHPRLVEGGVVAAPGGGEGGGDAIRLGASQQLGDHSPLSVYLQRFARADHVQVEHGDGAGEWVGGVFHVMSGAQESLLLAVPGGEEDRAGGAVVLRVPQPGDLQDRGDAGRVVVGPVHHGPVRLAAQMVVVSADDDDLILAFGVGAGEETQDVAGLDRLLFFQRYGHPHSGGEGCGGEAQAEVVQRVAGAGEQVLPHGLGDEVRGDGLVYPGGLAVAPAPERFPLFTH